MFFFLNMNCDENVTFAFNDYSNFELRSSSIEASETNHLNQYFLCETMKAQHVRKIDLKQKFLLKFSTLFCFLILENTSKNYICVRAY